MRIYAVSDAFKREILTLEQPASAVCQNPSSRRERSSNVFTAAAEDAADKPQSLKKFIIEEIFILPDYYKQLLFIFHSENTTDYTDQINDSGGFLQLVDIYVDMLRPLVGFCTIFLALF